MMKSRLRPLLVSVVVISVLLGPFTAFYLSGFELLITATRFYWTLACFTALALFAIGLSRQPRIQACITRWRASGLEGAVVKASSRYAKHQFALGCMAACALPLFLGKYWLSIAIYCLIYILLGLGLNIVVGLAGLLDLGFVAFYAVGAYGYALLSQYAGFGFWTALPCCALFAAFLGAVIGFPVLRMHGDYLAIVTLGFGEIIRLVLNNWASLTGGPNGIFTPFPTFFGIEFTRRAQSGGTTLHELFGMAYDPFYRYLFLYFCLLFFVVILIAVASRLRNLPIGRAWEALREDEIATRSLGIYHVTTKLAAFSMGAFVGGIGGAFFAAFQGFINPSSFTFLESALILAIVVLGGMGSVPGVVFAAIVVTLIPEILREISDVRMLAFGLLMVVMMIWRPRGLMKIKRRPIAQGARDA